jgi:glyoxylase-like metal-dependent hydrolase (beta-lactamase superfamily II)
MEQVRPNLTRIELRGVNAFLWTGQGGPTLIDTGYPWTYNKLLDALRDAGIQPADLQRIIITHCDLDHIGGLKGLTEWSEATIACHTVAAEYIEGKKRLPAPHSLAGLLFRAGNSAIVRIYKPFVEENRVQELLLDKEMTPEGFKVVHLPGHSPGQIGLYHKQEGIFIAGDAVVIHDGELTLPPKMYTVNMQQAIESLGKLKKLRFDTACFGHGPCITQGADDKIRAFVDSLS